MFFPKPINFTIFEDNKVATGDSYYVLNFTNKSVTILFTGAGSATFLLEGSNDNTDFVTLQTFTASGYYETTMPVAYMRGRTTAVNNMSIKADLAANK